MTRNTRSIAITLSVVSLSALVLLAILGAHACLNAGPIVDLRL